MVVENGAMVAINVATTINVVAIASTNILAFIANGPITSTHVAALGDDVAIASTNILTFIANGPITSTNATPLIKPLSPATVFFDE
ncbi:MAG: hypothetical protein AAFY78_24110 [Cyanobacteria bacterium J06648_16]